MQVILKRNGTDLSKSSSVFVRSRQTDPISARGKISWRVTETHLGFEMLIEYLILCHSPIILHQVKLLFRTNKSTWLFSVLFTQAVQLPAPLLIVDKGREK